MEVFAERVHLVESESRLKAVVAWAGVGEVSMSVRIAISIVDDLSDDRPCSMGQPS